MVFIFGGAYQGKLDYALGRFGRTESDVYRCGAGSTDTPTGKKIIYEAEKWILALVKAGIDTTGPVNAFIELNPGAVVICNDISCGVVPVDPVMRKWREAAGRAAAAFSHRSDEAVRLFCGIPMKLK
jgi:adenosyl cobinamide kinase/adenosyl cobinamide phosphate guanylyltransferase